MIEFKDVVVSSEHDLDSYMLFSILGVVLALVETCTSIGFVNITCGLAGAENSKPSRQPKVYRRFWMAPRIGLR